MRYSIRGRLSPDALDDALQVFTEHLRDHNVDEVRWLSIYYTPFSEGQKVEFHSADGELIEHIKVEPVKTQQFHGEGTAVLRVPVLPPAPAGRLKTGRHAIAIAELMTRWDLSLPVMARLLASAEDRVARTLAKDVPDAIKSDHPRLSLLLEIDQLYPALKQEIAIDQWLRSDAVLARYPEPYPLLQFIAHGSEALMRTRDAFAALAALTETGTATQLGAGFDEDILGTG